MQVIHSPHEVFARVCFERKEGQRVGLVPTMGALHAGHLSLVERAKSQCDIVFATIFVNPAQFGPNEDYAKYPRTREADLECLEGIGCDYVFAPEREQVYGPDHSTFIEPPSVAKRWEGELRPGHFRGVATVVLKLFMMAPADIAYFGRKDYQQVAVIRKMVEDLNLPIRLEVCDTVREADGLAMSSRNRYLSKDERKRALGLSMALQRATQLVEEGVVSSRMIEEEMRRILIDSGVDRIDYAQVVHGDSLEPLDQMIAPAVAIIAARLGTTRLLDNCTLA